MDSLHRIAIGSAHACWLLVLLLAGCNGVGVFGFVSGPSLVGSGVAKTETREIAPFTEIEVGNAIQLDATIGDAGSLVVTADDNILPHLKTVVEGDRLKIFVDVSHSSSLGSQVKITAPELSAIEGSGASRITATGVTGERFQLDLSGASKCELSSDTNLTNVTLSGASRCILSGACKQLTMECSGASHVDATKFSADKVVADVSGASSAHVNATEEVVATASGASKVRYAGNPHEVKRQTSGASTIVAEPTSVNSAENVELPL